MSIRLKLVIMFLGIAMIPVIFVGLITYQNYSNSIKTMTLSKMQVIASYKSQQIEIYFSGLKSDIETAQGFYNVRKNLPILSRLKASTSENEYSGTKKMLDDQLYKVKSALGLKDIMLVDLKGDVVYTTSHKNHLMNIREWTDTGQKAFKKGLGMICFSDVFEKTGIAGESGKFVLTVNAPVHDLNNVLSGVVVYEVGMETIYKIIQDLTGLGNTGETLIGKNIGNQAVFLNILRHDPDSVLKRKVEMGSNSALPLQAALSGGKGVGESIDYRGRKVISAWQFIPMLDWGLVAKIDSDEAYSDAANLGNLVILIIFIVIVLSGILAVSISQSISVPINRLSRGVELIGSGNLDCKVGTNQKDEIGQLSRAFDKMTSDLKNITASRDELNNEISERKKTENELMRSNENLEQFAYVASHDLQEPLRIMASYSELLERRYKDKLDKDANDFIYFIVDSAKRMQKLINDLLAYSRIGRTDKKMEETDLNEIMDKVIKSMSFIIEERKATITLDNLPVLEVNESSFIQLFQNLIGNALKFQGTDPPRVHVGAVRKNGEWLFSVRDNGIGIEPQYKDRIFMIFQRLHGRDEYPGTGIGLSICKKIVETYGGNIWVESEKGTGTVFYFTFPVKA